LPWCVRHSPSSKEPNLHHLRLRLHGQRSFLGGASPSATADGGRAGADGWVTEAAPKIAFRTATQLAPAHQVKRSRLLSSFQPDGSGHAGLVQNGGG
jgi:hypothetical protein